MKCNGIENNKLNRNIAMYLNLPILIFHDSSNCIGVETIKIKANLNAILTQHGLDGFSPIFP